MTREKFNTIYRSQKPVLSALIGAVPQPTNTTAKKTVPSKRSNRLRFFIVFPPHSVNKKIS